MVTQVSGVLCALAGFAVGFATGAFLVWLCRPEFE